MYYFYLPSSSVLLTHTPRCRCCEIYSGLTSCILSTPYLPKSQLIPCHFEGSFMPPLWTKTDAHLSNTRAIRGNTWKTWIVLLNKQSAEVIKSRSTLLAFYFDCYPRRFMTVLLISMCSSRACSAHALFLMLFRICGKYKILLYWH